MKISKIFFNLFYFLTVFYVLTMSSCSSFDVKENAAEAKTFVANYQDFGPSQLSRKLLGKKQWQWDDPENRLPVSYDVKVVVYRDIDLLKIKVLFPVDSSKKQDYRYVEYSEARKYLDETIMYFQKELESSSTPELYAMTSSFLLGLYKTALKMEQALRK